MWCLELTAGGGGALGGPDGLDGLDGLGDRKPGHDCGVPQLQLFV